MPRRVLALALLVALAPPFTASALVVTPQDDAGSARDAGETFGSAVPIAPGRLHQGNLTGFLLDDHDWYAIEGATNQTLHARAWGAVGCLDLREVDGTELAFSCTVGYASQASIRFELPHDGPFILDYGYLEAHTYWVSFALDAEAPGFVPGIHALDAFTASGPRPSDTGTAEGADAVLALIDDGINPYHEVFRDDSPRALQHPSTYIAGYPAEAEAIHITFAHESLAAALEADCAEWANVVPGQLYYFPGTRVVGAITMPSDDIPIWTPGHAVTCDDLEPAAELNLVGNGGHGTMTASRAAGEGIGACPSCLVVMVQGFGSDQVAWAGNQSWIDVQSNSWGPIVPGYLPMQHGLLVADSRLIRTIEETARRMPAFWAAGNGAAFRLGVLGHPTQLAPHLGPSAIRVGGHDSGYVETWSGLTPHVASDVCNSWAAEHASLHAVEPDIGSGTSAATPFVAGAAARVLIDVRLAVGDTSVGALDGILARGAPRPLGPMDDGVLTPGELVRALELTADERPTRRDQDAGPCFGTLQYDAVPVAWDDVPPGPLGIPFVGYGSVDLVTAARSRDIILGAPDVPVRLAEDAFFSADRAAREVAYAATTAVELDPLGEAPALQQNDAGSGRDAGTGANAVPISPGVYSGDFLSVAARGFDFDDEYAFEAQAGQTLRVGIRGLYVCALLEAPSGWRPPISACSIGAHQIGVIPGFVANETGTWRLVVADSLLQPDHYTFGLALDSPRQALPYP